MKSEIAITDLTHDVALKLVFTDRIDFKPSRLDIVNILYQKYSEFLTNISKMQGLSNSNIFQGLVQK
jgi:hypothetical protein